MSRDSEIDRREFLHRTGSAVLAVGAMGVGSAIADPADAADPPRIRRYVKLGNTGLEIADIGFGSGGCRSESLIRHCYDRGQNYFDTAEMYRSEGWSKGEHVESLLGRALKGKRDKVVITTKAKVMPHHDRKEIMAALEASLRRLQTDYVDIFLNHAVNDVERVKNPEWHEFVELAKKQGKIRFSGMSGHGGNLIPCLDYAVDNDLADVILCAYNFGTDPAFYERFTKAFDFIANQAGIRRVFEKAHGKGIGVIAMKTLMGARLNDLTPYQKDGVAFPRAAFRWVLSDPYIHSLIVSMKNRRLADQYMRASGDSGFEREDHAVLERYLRDNTVDYCRNLCDACASSCPLGVEISGVLRQRMYEERYGNPLAARQGYASLARGAAACGSCTDTPCAGACSFGLEIPSLLRRTHERLS